MDLSKTKDNKFFQKDEMIGLREKLNMENQDLKEQEVFDEITTSPLSHLLAMIGSLPEIRQEKVFNARDNVKQDVYEMDAALDSAIDKVLEELLNDS